MGARGDTKRDAANKCREQMERIRARLRELTEDSAMSLEDMAQAIGLSPSVLSGTLRENGPGKLSFTHVFALLEALDVPPASFFEDLYGSRRSREAKALEIDGDPRRTSTTGLEEGGDTFTLATGTPQG